MDVENEHTLVVHAPKDSNTFKNSQHGTAKQTHKFSFSRVSKIIKHRNKILDFCLSNSRIR